MNIEIDVEDYICMLENRRGFCNRHFEWGDVPDPVWDMVMDTIRECGVDPHHADPMDIVDNLIVNSEYEEFDDIRETVYDDELQELRPETNDEVYDRICGDCLAANPQTGYVLWHF